MIERRELQQLISELSAAEKAQVLRWLVRGLGGAYTGISNDLAVFGGDACIVRTRIPVWLLVQLRRQGATEADLLRNYPTLLAEDLANAWAFARSHPSEIDAAIDEHEAA